MQPNTRKHFPFEKIAFPENEIFSENAFTQTKHSLSVYMFAFIDMKGLNMPEILLCNPCEYQDKFTYSQYKLFPWPFAFTK